MQGSKQLQSNLSDCPETHRQKRQERQVFQTRMIQETQSYFSKLGVDMAHIDWLIQDLEQF